MSLPLPPALKGKYPAKAHTARVLSYLSTDHSSVNLQNSIIYLASTPSALWEDSDQPRPFRQRRSFFYLTGCELPDSALIHDAASNKSVLFIPPIDPDEVIWSGLPMSPEAAKKQYDVDEVKTTDQLDDVLLSHKTRTILALPGHADRTIWHDGTLPYPNTSPDLLKTAIDESRVVKDSYEIALIRHVNAISALAHRAVMHSAKSATNERELEAIFLQHCAHNGSRNMAYDAIVASGVDAGTLHYVRNDKSLLGADVGPMQMRQEESEEVEGSKGEKPLNLLIDAGAEFGCYASDVTRTFPLNGRFSEESRSIYELVLRVQKECMGFLKAGVQWEECHLLAHRVLIEGLLELGILKGGTVQEVLDSRVSTAFLPHGLGHYMGMDTHDTGGHADYGDKDPLFRYLRVRGKVPAGAIITVEPGCYFCRFILEPRLKREEGKRFIDADVLEKYWSVGGVRIEDDVLVTEEGSENLTQLPSGIEELEAIVSGG